MLAITLESNHILIAARALISMAESGKTINDKIVEFNTNRERR